jgi:pimeloyl-ACP methyl ester carboxylesterase
MPLLKRPDGVEIFWQERGAGPLVVVATQFFGYPEVFEELIADIARDFRVVTYDARGAGRSSRQGPFDMPTDAGDLGALIETAGAPALLVVGMGDGCNRAVRLAAERPDLVQMVLSPGANPVGRQAAAGTDALVDSPSVLEALLGLIETDYRAALRTMIASANPQMDEEQARERVARVVEYCPQDVGAARLRAWIEDESLEASQALGPRLHLLMLPETTNPWFSSAAADRTRELLPEAHVADIVDGPISRPDLVADAIRAATAESLEAEVGGERAARSG